MAGKTLYYFSTDLSNRGVKSGLPAVLPNLAPGNRLIKSASYLMHTGIFATVRDFLLANSATLIQDDSGIPLAAFDPKKWGLFPFGRYAGPIAKFPRMYQPKYAELFRYSQPMDFGIGYRWRAYESNLLLAVQLLSDNLGSADATSSAPAAEPAQAPQPKPPRPRKPRPPTFLEPPTDFFWFLR